ncbi:MAG: UxaA family hydrolase [Burkholderiaceae bacterium]|nr:UxaA family hydrolase [Burkholderiaceae bacterium]
MFTTAPKQTQPVLSDDSGWFQGFHREDGSVGVRNHMVVLSTVALTNRWAELAAEENTEAYVLSGDFLRGLRGEDAAVQDTVLRTFVTHPNVGATLILCFDRVSGKSWRDWAKSVGRPVEVLTMIEQDGMSAAVQHARQALARLDTERQKASRKPAPLSALTIALECGGSDATSALCSNPAVGRFVERVIDAGGTAIVSETAEFIGTEPIIEQRAVNDDVRRKIIESISNADQRMHDDSSRYRGINPTAENIEAGLTTLVEKSMGAVCKIGDCKLDGWLAFGEAAGSPGMYFMDTPFFSPISLTGMVAARAQIVLFTIGVFNPSGNPIAPTIKICGNSNTIKTWHEAIDLDVSAVVFGLETLDDSADRIEASVMNVANGAVTKNESLGDGQIIIPKTCPLI